MSELFLRVDIQNKESVDLNVLSSSLNALASQYDIFLKKEAKGEYSKKEQRRLLVKEIKKGSIIIDLVGVVTPLLTEMNSICEFGIYLKNTFDFFLNKGEKKHEYDKKDCQNIRNITDITARDNNGATTNFNVYGNNNTVHLNVYTYNNTEANAIQATTERFEKEVLEHEEQAIFEKELMYWEEASFNSRKEKEFQNGGKIVIEKFDKRPKKVIFLSEEGKLKCTTRNTKFPNQEWQNLLYHVDVEVVKIQDVIKEYKILKVHDDVDTFED